MYPYTIIDKENIINVVNNLVRCGYKAFPEKDLNIKIKSCPSKKMCLVIDCYGIFGQVNIFKEGGLDNSIKREYIANISDFLYSAYKLMNYEELWIKQLQ